MWEQIIIDNIAKIIAACFVMSSHEHVKIQVYYIINKKSAGIYPKSNRRLWKYIDPVGMLLFIFCNAGFSKSTTFFLKDKRTSLYLGLYGILSQLIMFFLFCGIARIMLNTSWLQLTGNSMVAYFVYFLNSLVFRLALFSLSSVLVNLFPMSAFDMGLLLTGKSMENFFKILKMDSFVKTLVLVSICIGLIYEVSYHITKFFVL